MYNKNHYLSSGISYIPVISTSVNQSFLKWTNVPIKSIYYNIYYTYSSDIQFTSSLYSLQNIETQQVTIISSNFQIISTYTTSQYTTLQSLSKIGPSTVTGLSTTYTRDSISVYRLGSTTNYYFSSIVPGISTTIISSTDFFQRMYSPTVSTLIKQAIYDYIPRDRIGEFTANPGNPEPLLGGIFGSNIPLPWYWSDLPSRYIGPGLSSIFTIFSEDTFYNDITNNFNYTLQNISTSISLSNNSLEIYRQAIHETVVNANINFETGSSISTAFLSLNSIFTNSLLYASTFGQDISTLSSSVTLEISTAIKPPTLNGYNIYEYISTYSRLYVKDTNILTNMLFSTMSSSETLLYPIRAFSTSVALEISTLFTSTALLNQGSLFSNISTYTYNIYNTIYTSTTVSTNYIGYLGLSTLLQSTFSSFYRSSTFNLTYKNISSYVSSLLYGFSTTQGIHFPVLGFASNFSTIQQITVFRSIYTDSIFLSSFVVSSLGINTTTLQNNTLTLHGGIHIKDSPIDIPCIKLPNIEFYSNPTQNTERTHIITYNSTVTFNSTNLVIHNSSGIGSIGINTAFPQYSLEIGSGGDARKPNGTSWTVLSDTRVKDNISTLDFMTAMGKISSLRLVNYRWAEEYRCIHKLPYETCLGFISQEVKAVFPNCVRKVDEGNISDLQILDTSQITFCKYAATQGLLCKVSSLQSRVNTLLKEY